MSMLHAAAVPVSLLTGLNHRSVAGAKGWPGLQRPVPRSKIHWERKNKQMPDADAHEKEHWNHWELDYEIAHPVLRIP